MGLFYSSTQRRYLYETKQMEMDGIFKRRIAWDTMRCAAGFCNGVADCGHYAGKCKRYHFVYWKTSRKQIGRRSPIRHRTVRCDILL